MVFRLVNTGWLCAPITLGYSPFLVYGMPSIDLRPSLILASGSPRRHALLAAAGFEFVISESGIEESRHEGESGAVFALRMAHEKALSVSRRNPAALIVAADTIVECEGEVLGKPADAADARRVLRMLSGRTHVVVTAYALARGGAIIEAAPVTSRVSFGELADDTIERY